MAKKRKICKSASSVIELDSIHIPSSHDNAISLLNGERIGGAINPNIDFDIPIRMNQYSVVGETAGVPGDDDSSAASDATDDKPILFDGIEWIRDYASDTAIVSGDEGSHDAKQLFGTVSFKTSFSFQVQEQAGEVARITDPEEEHSEISCLWGSESNVYRKTFP